MSQITRMSPLRYRSIFISDVHLGLRGCQASLVLDFLQSIECKHLYLVGDIVDLWAMKSGLYWPETHNQVVRAVLDKARHGTQVIYIPGNHDEHFRIHLDADFGHVAVRNEAIHTTADGRRFLVMHGDAFDAVVQNGKWLAKLGASAYDTLLALNGHISRIRRWLGLEYWSLAAFLKYKVKDAVSYISDFETALANEAKRRQLDGMICGHIHHAEIRDIEGIAYCNCGDWVESCTALAEHHDGRLELLRWTQTTAGSLEPPDLARAS
ncbi:MAG: UDP-2,3-diacylglucosamine diphosphatase [Sphingobacteriia bacterium]|nr:UDP-2,3-diacylglucosamine diphosphatase [Sphingobacteriia bacterium]NCC38890.1 UDP-2,3-diacylglucosamine diphosphatase [Gammaproteobacteria bacterium]